MPVEPRFRPGDLVMAKWPGSALYFQGEVEDMNDIEYLVKFDDPDESKLAIKFKDVQRLVSFRSRSQSRGRSPARPRKSPGRTRAASKSPSRVKAASKSPSRVKAASKSPARATKTRSPGRASTKMETSITNVSISSSTDSRSSAVLGGNSSSNKAATGNSSSYSLFSALNSNKADDDRSSSSSGSKGLLSTPLRHSARIATLEKQNNDVKTTTITTRSSSTSTTTSSSSGSSRGGVKSAVCSAGCAVLQGLSAGCGILFPALQTLPLIAFLVVTPMFALHACTKKKCTIQELPDLPRKLESYYDVKALTLVGGLVGLLLLLSFIPLRTRVLPNGAKARGNGLLSLVLLLLGIAAAWYNNSKNSVLYLYSGSRALLATHIVLAVLLALLLYVKSYYTRGLKNSDRLTGHFLPDLVAGRDVAPRMGSLDLKSFLARYVFIYSFLFNVVVMLRDFHMNSKEGYNPNPTLVIVCALQAWYFADFLVFEDWFFSTFEYNNQGMGLLVCLGYLTSPTYLAITVRNVLTNKPVLPWYCLAGMVVLFFAGYFMMRLSNNQKHQFRSNPSSPKLAHLESVPTSAGTRLLVSGWWGLVRHPNYMGSLVMQLALTLLCGFTYGLPWLLITFNTVATLVRVYQAEAACKKKYGLAWSNYTGRVRYRLIPKVF